MNADHPRIVVAEPFGEAAVAKLRAIGEVIQLPRCAEPDLVAAVGNCDALLVRSTARINEHVLDAAPRLRVIGRAGVGLENIDLEATRRRSIQVLYTPGAATDAVADLTIGLIVNLVRGIPSADSRVRAGEFDQARQGSLGRDLADLVVGIVGLGRIGLAVARRCSLGFRMTVLYNDIATVTLGGLQLQKVDMNHLLSMADILTLHVPLTSATRGMVCDQTLAKMKPGSYLVNTCRGAVVDAEALAKALDAGKLAGAALDVFDPEPLPPEHPLWNCSHTVFTPHIGARTVLGLARMEEVVDDMITVLKGGPARYPAWA